MRRSVLLLLILLLIAVGVGFLALIWMDMRSAATHPPPQHETRNERPPATERERPREHEQHRTEPGERRERQPVACAASGVTCESSYFAAWTWPADGSCHATVRNGFPEPDARCTPGGVVPSVSVATLRDPGWRTKCIRNCQSSEEQKHAAYEWYGMERPRANSGATQVCELDHLVPLELGGADGMGNIWPECGPDNVTLRERYFKQKDIVENYLAARVKAGEMPLDEAQRGIARDWVQYLEDAKNYCHGGRC